MQNGCGAAIVNAQPRSTHIELAARLPAGEPPAARLSGGCSQVCCRWSQTLLQRPHLRLKVVLVIAAALLLHAVAAVQALKVELQQGLKGDR